MRTSLYRTLAALAAFTLLAAGCGARSGGESSAPPPPPPAAGGQPSAQPSFKGGEDVTLAINPWVGSAVNAYVAKALIEDQLGSRAEVIELDENATWPALASGEADANLEIWPSGHAESMATYMDQEKSVVDGGPLGATGRIGWFIPTYMVEQNPELATWEGLNANSQLFATAETGSKGQFLAGDPSYIQYDADIIRNLGMNFQVVQSGSEAAEIAALDSAYSRQAPILMYFYTPQWAHDKYDLTKVELPAYTPECGAAPDAEKNCDYPDDPLTKVFSARLAEEAPEAHQLLSKLQITNEIQNEVARMVSEQQMEPEAAAKAWVEANPDVWRPWLPTA